MKCELVILSRSPLTNAYVYGLTLMAKYMKIHLKVVQRRITKRPILLLIYDGKTSVIDACSSSVFWGEDFCDEAQIDHYFKLMDEGFLSQNRKSYYLHSLVALALLVKMPRTLSSTKVNHFPLLPMSFFNRISTVPNMTWVYLAMHSASQEALSILRFLRDRPFTLCAGLFPSSDTPLFSQNCWPWINDKWLTKNRYQSLLLQASIWVIDGGDVGARNPSLVHALLMAKVVVCVGEALPSLTKLKCNHHYFLVRDLREFEELVLKLAHYPELVYQMRRYNRLYAQQYLSPSNQSATIWQTLSIRCKTSSNRSF